ncbi:MAG: fumarylacetoacetate hydrolase family protein [Candidatus Marinimicrobia bacterium]|nr:fumarylacetoacetate hydrolase family protein [Candidatus Neomarinimicrobiota bacterium]
MKLLSYGLDQRMEPRLAFLLNGYAVDVMRASLWMKENHKAQDYLSLPSSMKLALLDWGHSLPLLQNLERALQGIALAELNIYGRPVALLETDVVFFAPVPDPPALRYFAAFEPDAGFSFGNTQTLLGNNQPLSHAGLTAKGEIACVIAGKETALQIAGYCIVNNWFDTQLDPNNGLTQGLATSLGPYLVTADELGPHKLGQGFSLDLQMRINGLLTTEYRLKNMTVSFSEMIKSALKTRAQAGDVFCSGSPSNLKSNRPTKPGDRVEVEIQVLGTLTTHIKEKDDDTFR